MKNVKKKGDCIVSSSVDNIPAKEILCKYIIPLYGKELEYKDVNVTNKVTGSSNILFMGREPGCYNQVSNCKDVVIFGNSYNNIITDTYGITIKGNIVPDLSSFWKRLKFCWDILFRYVKK